MSVLAVDAGTTGVTALVVTEEGLVSGRGYQEFRQYFPEPGWVEHLPEDIWQATLAASRQALTQAGDPPVRSLGITNQRETAVVWDRVTLAAPRRAIVWQDRRTARICDALREAGHEPRVAGLTGLRLDPYFTGTKLTWLAEHEPRTWAGLADGSLACGTVDSYLIARITAGARHVTDASNASRTLLFDIAAGEWSGELCELFRVPRRALPEVVPSTGVVARTDPGSFLGLDIPVAGVAGDQQAALFGQACFSPGDTKCTYGTGSFVLANTGPAVVRSPAGLLSTVAWMDGSGQLTYALEGSVFVTGAAVQWLRDGLGLLDHAAQSEALARSVPDSGGVVFVPALTGLGAPDWDPGHDPGACGPGHAGGDRLRGAGRGRPDDGGRLAGWPRAARRRRGQRQRPAHAAPGGSAAGPGGTPGGRRDHRARGRLPGRAGHRDLVLDRGAGRDLAPGPPVRARSPGRRGLRPLAPRRNPHQRLVRPQRELIAEERSAHRGEPWCTDLPIGRVPRSPQGPGPGQWTPRLVPRAW
jgi:glycerol kinase